jgi:hypothetical protein
LQTGDETPLVVTDGVLFRWARIIKIANMFPVMHAIRELEHKLQTACRSCGYTQRQSEPDRRALADARRLLAECSDDKARIVKESAGIIKYRLQCHDISGTVRDVVR